jgi:hypothetical protein
MNVCALTKHPGKFVEEEWRMRRGGAHLAAVHAGSSQSSSIRELRLGTAVACLPLSLLLLSPRMTLPTAQLAARRTAPRAAATRVRDGDDRERRGRGDRGIRLSTPQAGSRPALKKGSDEHCISIPAAPASLVKKTT